MSASDATRTGPERIYARTKGQDGGGVWTTAAIGDTEYVRADLHEERRAFGAQYYDRAHELAAENEGLHQRYEEAITALRAVQRLDYFQEHNALARMVDEVVRRATVAPTTEDAR